MRVRCKPSLFAPFFVCTVIAALAGGCGAGSGEGSGGDSPSDGTTSPVADDEWRALMEETPAAPPKDRNALEGLWIAAASLGTNDCTLRARFTERVIKVGIQCVGRRAVGVEVPYQRESPTEGTTRPLPGNVNFLAAREVSAETVAVCHDACCKDPVVRLRVSAGPHEIVPRDGVLPLDGLSVQGVFRGCPGAEPFSKTRYENVFRKIGD